MCIVWEEEQFSCHSNVHPFPDRRKEHDKLHDGVGSLIDREVLLLVKDRQSTASLHSASIVQVHRVGIIQSATVEGGILRIVLADDAVRSTHGVLRHARGDIFAFTQDGAGRACALVVSEIGVPFEDVATMWRQSCPLAAMYGYET